MPAPRIATALARRRKDSNQKAVELAQRALELDPKMVEAQELLAKLALEDNNEQKAIEEADKALKISPEALDAMAVRLAIDLLHDKKDSEWEGRRSTASIRFMARPGHCAGHILVLNRRYEEGIALLPQGARTRSRSAAARAPNSAST